MESSHRWMEASVSATKSVVQTQAVRVLKSVAGMAAVKLRNQQEKIILMHMPGNIAHALVVMLSVIVLDNIGCLFMF